MEDKSNIDKARAEYDILRGLKDNFNNTSDMDQKRILERMIKNEKERLENIINVDNEKFYTRITKKATDLTRQSVMKLGKLVKKSYENHKVKKENKRIEKIPLNVTEPIKPVTGYTSDYRPRDIIEPASKIAGVTLAGILALTVIKGCDFSILSPYDYSNERSQKISAQPLDKRKYIDSKNIKKIFTTKTFPNHMKNPKTKLEKLISKNCKGDERGLIYALLEHESAGWNPNAVSKASAAGLGQFMLATANEYGKKLGFKEIKYPHKVKGKTYTEKKPYKNAKHDWRFNPGKSILATIAYIKDMKKQFKDDRFVLAAYNAGPGSKKTGKGVRGAMKRARSNKYEKVRKKLPKETRKYVDVVGEKAMLYNMELPIQDGKNFNISSPFGYRKHPIYKKRLIHRGSDFAAKKGVPIVATTDGLVVRSGFEGNGFGKQVWITDDYDNIHLYGHMSRTKTRKGRKIKKGTVLGYVGNTGRSSGNHLHYALLDVPLGYKLGKHTKYGAIKSTAVNPARYLNKRIILKKPKK